MKWGVHDKRDPETFVGMDGQVLGFDTRVQAEDFADDMEEEGEWDAALLPDGVNVVMMT
jgi:hypothetical protein